VTPDDFKSASDLLDLLRSKGARSFKGFGLELELSPLAPEAEKVTAAGPQPDVNVCACGHAKFNHGSMGCTEGPCDPVEDCKQTVTQ
jgi:hypothetical protein